MKKFLFTLAALLMAGTAFAATRFYIDDQVLTQDQLGTQLTMYVMMENDVAFNAYEIHFAVEGDLTLDQCKVVKAAFSIPYVDQYGEEDDADVRSNNLGSLENGYMGFIATEGYWTNPDGVFETYGAIKWMPNDEPIQWYELKVTPAATFTGGKITLSGNFSSGADKRDIPTAGAKLEFESVCNITVEQPQQPVVAPTPKFDWDEDELVMLAYVEGEEENPVHEVVLKIGDQVVDNPYLVEQTTEEQTITFTAYTKKAQGEDQDSEPVEMTVTVPAKDKTPSAAPQFAFDLGTDAATITVTGTSISAITVNGTDNYTIEGNVVTIPRPAYGEDAIVVTVTATNTDEGWVTPTTKTSDEYTIAPKAAKVYETKTPTVAVTEGADAYTLTASCEDEGEVVLVVVYIDNETGATNQVRYENGTVTINRTDEDQYINYWAEATANLPQGYDEVEPASSTPVTYFEIPAKEVVEDPTLAGQIVFSDVNQENGQFTVKYVGDEAGVTITLDDETIELVRDVENKYQLPDYGTYNVTATAAATGYKSIDKDATLVWTKTEPAEKPGVPEIKQVLGETTVTVSAEAENAEEVHMYKWDPTANNGEGDFVYGEDGKPVEIENPTTYNMGDEPQTFYVMAVATNDAGETWTTNYATVVIPANPATSVNELVNGKTVAGVRYFNMAGQEMQEANGVT